MKKAVLFDLDDTLLWDERSIDEAFAETCQLAQETYRKINPEELEKSVRNTAKELYATYETFPFTKMIGINPFEGLWGRFRDDEDNFRQLSAIVPTYRKEAWTKGLQAIGIDDPKLGETLAERFPQIRRTKHYVYDDTYPTLERLVGKVKLLLLTNGSPDLQHEKLAGVSKLPPYFDHILVSGSFGRGKPEPALFRHALDMLNVLPEEAVMVGDKLTTDIDGANQTGITSVWINRKHKKRDHPIIPDYEINRLEEIHHIIEQLNEE